ncbi:MAG: STAS domain-containing protein [Actinomycetota bacterium]|nr:STAS domain-containing protein [Actinomycetota bacterium]
MAGERTRLVVSRWRVGFAPALPALVQPACPGGPVLEINVDETGEYTVCRPIGELDAFTVGQFREILTELGGSQRLLIDLSGVPFLDSAGLGALIGGVRRAREAGGDVAVYGARPAVARLLHTTGFDRVASVSDDEATAASALSDGPPASAEG